MSGENTAEEVRITTDELKLGLNKGGLTLKGITFSGSDPPGHLTEDGVTITVAGMKWLPKEDIFKLNIGELNFSKKHRGRKDQNTIGVLPEVLTRRDCVGKLSEIFDPLGRMTPITCGIKADIHELTARKLDWDDKIPDVLRQIWENNFEMMQELRNITFKRAIVPDNAVNLEIETLDTADASNVLICVAIYARFKLRSGKHSCQLVFARSKIVAKDTSMPRAELQAAILNAMTGHIVKISFGEYHKNHLKITDSQVTLHWIHTVRSELKLWVRNRVIEINRLTDKNRWRYVQSKNMIADIGTRKGAKMKDVGPDSEWINGKPWMSMNECDFSLKMVDEVSLSQVEMNEISKESINLELINKSTNSSHLVLDNYMSIGMDSGEVEKRYAYSKYVIDPNKFRLRKVLRILALVIKFVRKLRRITISKTQYSFEIPKSFSCEGSQYLVTTGKSDVMRCDPGKVICLSNEDIKAALAYFFLKATAEVKKLVSTQKYRDVTSEINGILYYNSRILPSEKFGDPIGLSDVAFDLISSTFCVPVVDYRSPIAYALVLEVHRYHPDAKHAGIETVLRYTQLIAHILNGRNLVNRVSKNCVKCRIDKKQRINVEMGPKVEENMKIAPAFYTSQVDLFGPFQSYSNVNKRASIKIWFAIFCCSVTGAIDVKVMENYSTESFLLAFIRFACKYGYPKTLLTDEGSQLVRGCKAMVISFIDLKHKLNVEYEIDFKKCPVGAHYMHGRAERKIQHVQKSMMKQMINDKLSIIQWETLLATVANSVNNMPLALGNKVDSVENLDIITPNRLLLGRNNDRCPSEPLCVSDNYSRLIENIHKFSIHGLNVG